MSSEIIKPRVYALVDGFNLYHAINDFVKRKELKWLNVLSLARAFVSVNEDLRLVKFFTALPPWDESKRERHQLLLDVYRDLQVNIEEGEFRKTTGRCWGACKEIFECYSEKETDINIALSLVRIAKDKMCDKVILVTGDSDQIPSIRYAKQLNSALRIKVVLPPYRRADQLKETADENASINVQHLERHQLANPYSCTKGGREIRCPGRWLA